MIVGALEQTRKGDFFLVHDGMEKRPFGLKGKETLSEYYLFHDQLRVNSSCSTGFNLKIVLLQMCRYKTFCERRKVDVVVAV